VSYKHRIPGKKCYAPRQEDDKIIEGNCVAVFQKWRAAIFIPPIRSAGGMPVVIANSKADTSIAEIQDRAEVNPMYLKRELFSFEVYGILFLERLIGMI
jgi:hypothetical protein